MGDGTPLPARTTGLTAELLKKAQEALERPVGLEARDQLPLASD